LQEYGAPRLVGIEFMDEETDVQAQASLLAAVYPPQDQEPRPARNCGLAGRGQAHLLDAATFISEEWDKLTGESIVHCSVKSTILPASMNASVAALHAENRQKFSSVEDDVNEVLSLLRGTSLGKDVVGGETEDDAREGKRGWFAAEDEEDASSDTADLIVLQPGENLQDKDASSGGEV